MFVSRVLLVLAAAPAGLLAQTVAVPPLPPVPAIAPVLAQLKGTFLRAEAVQAQVQGQLIRAQAVQAPALALLQGSLIRAQTALAASAPRLATIASVLGAVSLGGERELDRMPPEAWAQQDAADRLYRDGRNALNESRWTTAADLFAQIYTKHPRSAYAGDAYYWQAFALSKRDTDRTLKQALDVLKLQEEKAPNASTRKDADILKVRIEGQLAQSGDPEAAAQIARKAATAVAPTPVTTPAPRATRQGSRRDCDNNDDVATMAMNALQNMESSRALPILEKVLARRDPESVCLRRRAMFIVSQQDGAPVERILLQAARSDPDQEVREQAIFWLSQVNSPAATIALDSVLRNASDPVLQDKAIFALSQQNSPRAKQALRDFALRSEVSNELREKAIFWIGQTGGQDAVDFLKSLYGQLKSEELKDKLLFSISQVDNRESGQWLLGVAADVNESIELRKKALFWVGQSDYPLSELATLYERMPNREMKKHLIFVYSQRNERAAVDRLMSIARTEKDKELQKDAIFWLSQMNDPRIPDFIASLLVP